MEKNIKIIDAENAIAGRLASYVAKQALNGEEIKIINCEKAIVSGNRKNIQKKFLEKRQRVGSGQKGPKISKSPDKILKKIIRDMLPYRNKRGRDAIKKVKCYIGIPMELKNQKKIVAGKEKPIKFVRIEDLSR